MAGSADKVLVDTSAWIEALRRDGDPAVRDQVRTLVTDDAAVLCDLVVLELWNGARGDRETQALTEITRELARLPTTDEVWRTAVNLARACRTQGLTVPATDLVVAACARAHGASLLHRDRHFDLIAETVTSS